MREALFIACVVVAAGALAYLGADAISALYRRRAARQPAPEAVSPAPATPPTRRLPVRLVQPAQPGERPTPTVDDQTDQTDQPARDEAGADERYADDLRAITQELRRHPGFTTDEPPVPAPVEIEPADSAHWATLDAAMAKCLAECDIVLARLLPSSLEDTGQIDRAELAALLDDERAGASA
jgi:hypothetical protein